MMFLSIHWDANTNIQLIFRLRVLSRIEAYDKLGLGLKLLSQNVQHYQTCGYAGGYGGMPE